MLIVLYCKSDGIFRVSHLLLHYWKGAQGMHSLNFHVHFNFFFHFFFIKAAANMLLVKIYGIIWTVFKSTYMYLQAVSRQRDVSVIYRLTIQFQSSLFTNKLSLNLYCILAQKLFSYTKFWTVYHLNIINCRNTFGYYHRID